MFSKKGVGLNSTAFLKQFCYYVNNAILILLRPSQVTKSNVFVMPAISHS